MTKCAKLQNSVHLGSVGIFQGPPRGETQTPPCGFSRPVSSNVWIPCFPPRDKGRRRNALESAVPPLASIRCGPRNCITFQNLLSALETRMEPSKVPVPGSHWFNPINYLVENPSPSQRRWCRCCQAQGTANASSPISLAVAGSAFFQASNEFVERGQVRRRL